MNESPLLKITEAAEILKVSRFTVSRMAKARAIPTIVIGKRVMIPKTELLEWIKANTHGGG